MTDYDVENQMVIRIVARRNDGLYKTEVVQYPNEGTDYGGEIIVPMFGMAKSLVAQIVGVKINGTEVRVNSTEVEGADITARYDDSLTRMGWEESMNNIHLDFEVISTNNPKTLRIADNRFQRLSKGRSPRAQPHTLPSVLCPSAGSFRILFLFCGR